MMPYKLFNYLLLLLAILSTACSPDTDIKDTQKNLPQTHQNKPDNGVRVVSIDGQKYHYIPIADKTFLIPDKVWLKGYSRNATDNQVSYISLHATAPNLNPIDKNINKFKQSDYDYFYNSVEVSIEDKTSNPSYNHRLESLPHGLLNKTLYGPMVDIPSEYSNLGLTAFGWVPRNNLNDGIYYRFEENGKIKYFIRCSQSAPNNLCNLKFTYGKRIVVDMEFNIIHMENSLLMADKLKATLNQFEQAAQQYKPQ